MAEIGEGDSWIPGISSSIRIFKPCGIVQFRYRGRRVGARITKTAANEFVGQILSFKNAKGKFEDLTLNDFIAFREENIFGYDPPAKN